MEPDKKKTTDVLPWASEVFSYLVPSKYYFVGMK